MIKPTPKTRIAILNIRGVLAQVWVPLWVRLKWIDEYIQEIETMRIEQGKQGVNNANLP